MHIPTHGPGTVGREDRLVRGCIALSLLLLVGFVVVLSGDSGPVGLALGALGLHFTVTAALGRDPFYAHFGIDTRTEAETGATPETVPQGPDLWPPLQNRWVDLRDSDSDLTTGSAGGSLLGS